MKSMPLLYVYIYIYIYIYMYVNVLVYEIQRGLNIGQIEQIELYRLPQKVTEACFILRKNLQESPEDSFSR